MNDGIGIVSRRGGVRMTDPPLTGRLATDYLYKFIALKALEKLSRAQRTQVLDEALDELFAGTVPEVPRETGIPPR